MKLRPSLSLWLLLLVAALLAMALAMRTAPPALAAAAPAPGLVVPDIPPGVSGASGAALPPNILLNLSLTFADAGAAYRAPYDGATVYPGYFNPALCYHYPMKARSTGATEPDLDERSGHFTPAAAADAAAGAEHACQDAFSGNFLNWATASTLDLLRYGLTGGDRVIDDDGLTVLQRAWLPDGTHHPDFYASPAYFPRKVVAGAQVASVTPFPGAELYIVSCRNRVLFSTTAGGASCDAARYGADGALLASDKFHGEFNVRVAVCDAADSASRPDLCRAYGQRFKPEGSVQRAGAQSRIGLMSHLAGRVAGGAAPNGGVLRAPLKLLGAGVEWDRDSGIAASNPDGAAGNTGAGGGVLPGVLSGAINYINQFGRGSAATRGAYPVSGPGAELFYEALHYLQGRAGDAAAIDDGFATWPVRADPVLAACQRQVVATIGHAAFGADRYLPGNTRTDLGDAARALDTFAPGAPFDVMQATRRVGDMEADLAGAYGNAAPRADLAGLDLRDTAGGSHYLAGAAYWANTNAIRPDLALRVASSALELGPDPLAGGSALYLAAKYGGFADRNADANPFITSGQRRDDSEWRGADGRPAHFYGAATPHNIIGAARALLQDAGAIAGQVQGAVVAGPLKKGKGFLIATAYDAATWSGTLQRRALSIGPAGEVTVGAEAEWDAAAILDGGGSDSSGGQQLPPPARKLYTLAYGADGVSATIAFDWDTLGPDTRAMLSAAAPGGAGDALGAARTAFLRGERTRELGRDGGLFRRRAGVLGDMIRSLPLLVGAPAPSTRGAGFAEFHQQRVQRPAMAYVGANDGMLHAFDSSSGAELFAYLPHALMPSLSMLTDPAYRHRAYVDASAGAGEALLGARWRTVLASGMGMGARGVFALDISDPGAFESGMGALWEFTDKDDPAMGHVHAPPLIVKLRTSGDKGPAKYRYFAMVASGINNAAQDGAGALFLLALDKSPADAWQRGVNYYRFATPTAGDALSAAAPKALAPPALALAGDGSVRLAYAGDLQGNLWRFDFSGAAPWAGALRAAQAGEPLFVARDTGGKRQPVSHAPRVVFAPGGAYLVLFGTGKLIEQSDLLPASFAQQSLYAVLDIPSRRAGPPLTRADLSLRTLSGAARVAVVGERADLEGQEASAGWYADFAHGSSAGERAAGSPMVAGGALVFDTVLPGADPCAPPSTRNYVLDALSGFAIGADGVARSGEQTGALSPGMSGSPPLIVETGAGIGPVNATGGASATRRFVIVRAHDAGGGPGQQVDVRFQARRLSWREVINWQDLHQAASK